MSDSLEQVPSTSGGGDALNATNEENTNKSSTETSANGGESGTMSSNEDNKRRREPPKCNVWWHHHIIRQYYHYRNYMENEMDQLTKFINGQRVLDEEYTRKKNIEVQKLDELDNIAKKRMAKEELEERKKAKKAKLEKMEPMNTPEQELQTKAEDINGKEEESEEAVAILEKEEVTKMLKGPSCHLQHKKFPL